MELYHRLNVLKPAMARRLIFVTGDALNPAVLEFLDYTGCPHIEKPFVPVEVRQDGGRQSPRRRWQIRRT